MIFKRRISIAIPASLVSDIPHLREKTLKIGMVGRAVAIFGVDEVIVFPDVPEKNQNQEINLMATILSYMETPQYLRKRLFKIRPELKFAGVLPPLRTPHHPLLDRVKDLADGEFREGVAVSHTEDGSLVDVGVERCVLVRQKQIPMNTRVTVKIRKTRKLLEAEVADPREIAGYWGYRITRSSLTLGKLLRIHGSDLVIAASRYGKLFQEISGRLEKRWKASRRILVAFGAPALGLYEIAKKENLELPEVSDFVVNTIPNQKVETVRTEEALLVTLGILNLMTAKS